MHICYFDEVPMNSREIHGVHARMLVAKSELFGDGSIKTHTDPPEVKGRDMRRKAGTPESERFMEAVFEVFRDHDVRVLARVFVKQGGMESKGEAIYNRAVELSCQRFHDRLEALDHDGIVVADSRDPKANHAAAASIAGSKLRSGKDRLPRLADLPTFGQSESHIGLQLADIVCSALLYPLAISAYTETGKVDASLVRWAPKLAESQRRYVDAPAKQLDGVSVYDLKGKPLATGKLFE